MSDALGPAAGAAPAWVVAVDRGGTFTDVVARAPDGHTLTLKLPSESPAYGDATTEALRRLRALHPERAFHLAELRLGTTVATNALLERRGARVLWVTTMGHRDALRIGHQARPDLFARRIVLAPPLAAEIVEAHERVSANGEVLQPLNLGALGQALRPHLGTCDGVVVAFLHGAAYPEHEQRAAALALGLGFGFALTSYDTSRIRRFVPRAQTAIADGFTTPALRDFLARVSQGLRSYGTPPLRVMQSNGLLATHSSEGREGGVRGMNTVLSGPAGGVLGVRAVRARHGMARVVGLDMGGTSTDVCAVVDDQLQHDWERPVGGVRLLVPTLPVHTVAAGGGSVVRLDGELLRVGPESAGATPGPAAAGRGGPATVTDACLVTGRLTPSLLPAVFGPGGDAPADLAAARAAFAHIAAGLGCSVEAAAEAVLEVAVVSMARGVRRVSTEKGYDVRDFTLCAFGGAAGQLACRVAEALGVSAVVVPRDASVLSAAGILGASQGVVTERVVDQPYGPEALRYARALAAEIPVHGVAHARCHLRGSRAITSLAVPLLGDPEAAYRAQHVRLYGSAAPEQLVLDRVSVEDVESAQGDRTARGGGPGLASSVVASGGDLGEATPPAGAERLGLDALRWEALAEGAAVAGPLRVVSATTTVVVEAGWDAVHTAGDLVLSRRNAESPEARRERGWDPAALAVLMHRIMAIAEEMGQVVEQTAASVNIAERRDYSCAVFDTEGRLVANAPHIPVHLGSMSDAVRAVFALHVGLCVHGDLFIINDPAHGGTHLPDLTIVAAVSLPGAAEPVAVAVRGHHADVGGVAPGSMPAHSTRLSEEGLLFSGERVGAGFLLDEAAVLALLARGPWPARTPQQSLQDLRAQVAACARGAERLRDLFSDSAWLTGFAAIRQAAAHAVARLLPRLRLGAARCALDDGGEVVVALRRGPTGRYVVDFTGTSPALQSNANAPRAVVRAAVLYVLRVLTEEDIPLNDGCLEPLDLLIPPGSLLDPPPGSAVVAGNVETSQLVCDALFLATGTLAGSQGTMNNVAFGDGQHQYYETLAGGAGAGPVDVWAGDAGPGTGPGLVERGFAGASAVQCHMTNSRLTDPEVLETRLPVRVRRFEVRLGSGGDGAWPGGDGVTRELEFTAPVTLSLLTGRRRHAPPGLDGGNPGVPGRQWLLRGAHVLPLGHRAEVQVVAGDILRIETPGGGGYLPPTP